MADLGPVFFSCSSGGWYITSLFDWFFSGGSDIFGDCFLQQFSHMKSMF